MMLNDVQWFGGGKTSCLINYSWIVTNTRMFFKKISPDPARGESVSDSDSI